MDRFAKEEPGAGDETRAPDFNLGNMITDFEFELSSLPDRFAFFRIFQMSLQAP